MTRTAMPPPHISGNSVYSHATAEDAATIVTSHVCCDVNVQRYVQLAAYLPLMGVAWLVFGLAAAHTSVLHGCHTPKTTQRNSLTACT